jgi:hypothetical protein
VFVKEKKLKRARVNMRIPASLLKWAKVWAKKRNTTLTQTIIDFLTDKRDEASNA